MTTVPAKRPANRVLPPNLIQAAVIVAGFAALLYLVEFADRLHPADLETNGIIPRTVDGLDGIIWSPLLHAEWAHLIGNSVPLVVFAFLAMANGLGQWVAVTATIWLVSGVGVWLTSPDDSITIGASGLCFGWLAFLLVRGLFNRSFRQLVVAFVLFAYWGTTLLGVLPGNPGISWQGHLFGAVGGVLAAWFAAVADKPIPAPSTFRA